MNVVFTNVETGTVNADYSYNTELFKTENGYVLPTKTVDADFFTMLVEKTATLTIKLVDTTKINIAFIDEDGFKTLQMHYSTYYNSIYITFEGCFDIAGQVYIENYNIIIVKFIQYGLLDLEKYITEFPIVDNTVKFLAIESPHSIGEECTYFNNLSPNLKALLVSTAGNIECYFNNFPLQLECFELNCKVMKYPIEPLPVDLKCLKLNCKQYNFMIDFPRDLKHCEIYCDDYSHGIANVSDSVVVLGISYNWITDIEKLPKKCKMLGYSECPDELYNDLTKRKLKVMIVKHNFSQQIITSKIHKCYICVARTCYTL